LGPEGFDPAAPCERHQALYTVDLDDLRLAVMDDATADDTSVVETELPAYQQDLQSLAAIAAPVWFIHHRPIWAAISGPLGVPVGGNKTLIAAAGSRLVPGNVALQLSGHIHSFEAINYDGALPPQIVAGNGGDKLDVTPRNLGGAVFQGNSGVRVHDGLSVGGFGFLLMTRAAHGWTIDLYNSDGHKMRQCRFRDLPGRKPRLDCPV